MTTTAYEPDHEEMESLFVNNENLELIATWLNRFNPIRMMKADNMEIRHSNILAWLLDPKETHGLGDHFLKAFLAEALRGHSKMGKPTALDILQSDLRDAEIRREWQNIDIFIYSPENGWAFVIENKFNSSQHEGQLSKYIEKVKSFLPSQEDNTAIRGIFLTLEDEEPQDKSYVPIRYSAICEFLPRLIEQKGLPIDREVETFLRHYLEIIREETGMSTEHEKMQQLARELYRTHRKVLDFVIEHGARTDFIVAVEALFGENREYGDLMQVDGQEYMFSGLSNEFFSFLPARWCRALGEDDYVWPGCDGWWAGYPLVCWLRLRKGNNGTKGQVRLFAEVGPISIQEFRVALIQRIKDVAAEKGLKDIGFQEGAVEEGRKYSRFFKRNTVAIDDIQNADEIAEAMKELLKRFEPCFEAVAEILPEFVKYGETVDD